MKLAQKYNIFGLATLSFYAFLDPFQLDLKMQYSSIILLIAKSRG
jgi:hypothetical protein